MSLLRRVPSSISPCGSDGKYKDQVGAAHRVLSESIRAEMTFAEIIEKNNNIFSGLLGFSKGGFSMEVERQMMERLSAVEMLNVLTEFVVAEDVAASSCWRPTTTTTTSTGGLF